MDYFAIRKGRRIAPKTQEQAALVAGYRRDRFIRLEVIEVEDLIGLAGRTGILRTSNRLGVYRYEFLAPLGNGPGDKTSGRALKKITDRLLEIGAVVDEVESGRSFLDDDGSYRIFSDAKDRLAGARRHDRPGRPKIHDYSDDDLLLIEAVWHNKEYRNPKQREAAVQEIRDPEGRQRFPRFKIATWYDIRKLGRVK